MNINSHKFQNFMDAFDSGTSGFRRECTCGREYYNSNGDWGVEENELKELRESNAFDLSTPVGFLYFEGKEFVWQCDCWHERAFKLIKWIDAHAYGIANYLSKEKERKQDIAARSPIVS